MSSNAPYPPSSNPTQQQLNQYPPPTVVNYGSAYPPPMNQGAYPPPVETVSSGNPAYPPPPYNSSFGQPNPNPHGQEFVYPTPVSAPPPSYPPPPPTSDVAFQGSNIAYHDRIISFDDKTIRLGMFVWVKLRFLFCITLFSLFY